MEYSFGSDTVFSGADKKILFLVLNIAEKRNPLWKKGTALFVVYCIDSSI
jgi:hypothetical protein